jgi:hypothetical protein
MYRALHALGSTVTLQDLDTSLDEIQRRYPKSNPDYWGIASCIWHYHVVSYTLRQKYGAGNYVFKKLPLMDLFQIQTGTIIVDGYLNSRVWFPNDSDHTDRSQRHCVAVDVDKNEYYEFCSNEPDGTLTMESRRFRQAPKGRASTTRPYILGKDPSKNYFRRICKIFLFDPHPYKLCITNK